MSSIAEVARGLTGGGLPTAAGTARGLRATSTARCLPGGDPAAGVVPDLETGALAAAVPREGVVGVGIDVVDVERFRRVLERRPRLADRLFTRAELAYARGARDPLPRLSARFAAKEAAMKALGVGIGAFSFAAAEVVRDGGGRPELVMHGPAEVLAEGRGVTGWHLSLTHTDRLALALAVGIAAPGGS